MVSIDLLDRIHQNCLPDISVQKLFALDNQWNLRVENALKSMQEVVVDGG